MNRFTIVICVILACLMFVLQSEEYVTRDGLVCYRMNVDKDTTYTFFSVYGMRENLHFEIADSLVKLYDTHRLKDTLDIKCSLGRVQGIVYLQSYGKNTFIDFCASKYIWNDGKVIKVQNHCPMN